MTSQPEPTDADREDRRVVRTNADLSGFTAGWIADDDLYLTNAPEPPDPKEGDGLAPT